MPPIETYKYPPSSSPRRCAARTSARRFSRSSAASSRTARLGSSTARSSGETSRTASPRRALRGARVARGGALAEHGSVVASRARTPTRRSYRRPSASGRRRSAGAASSAVLRPPIDPRGAQRRGVTRRVHLGAAPLEPGAARAIQQQVAEAQAQRYRPPIAGAAPLGGGAAVAAALAALAAAALAVNFAVVAWIGLFVYGFFVAIAVELARHALAVARGWPRMIVDARRCQLATAACAVVLTAYPASLLLFESGLLAPLAVPLGYLSIGFIPMALWMRKAERW